MEPMGSHSRPAAADQEQGRLAATVIGGTATRSHGDPESRRTLRGTGGRAGLGQGADAWQRPEGLEAGARIVVIEDASQAPATPG